MSTIIDALRRLFVAEVAPVSKRGIHWSASTNHPTVLAFWLRELSDMGIHWVKLLDDSRGSSVGCCVALVEAGFEPIVRMYRAQPNPGTLDTDALGVVERLVGVGVRYFETNNEPNLRCEWQDGPWRSWSAQTRVDTAVGACLLDAEQVLKRGGLPSFPALAQCAHTMNDDAIGSIPFYDMAVSRNAEKLRQMFQRGMWLAVHDATLNHCYEDSTGWHFEYPYDPVNQKDHPGATVLQDDCSLIGHRAALEFIHRHLGKDVNPAVISTEGGVFMPDNGFQTWDTRYPGYDYNGQAVRTVAMFEWLEKNAPEVVGMCPWLIANETMGHDNQAWTNHAWYHKDGPRPVVQAMKDSTPVTEDEIREWAWNEHGVAYNPDAAFPKFARGHQLGIPMTAEFDIGNVRAQGFAGGIVYCVIGDWSNIRKLEW